MDETPRPSLLAGFGVGSPITGAMQKRCAGMRRTRRMHRIDGASFSPELLVARAQPGLAAGSSEEGGDASTRRKRRMRRASEPSFRGMAP
jgi:hypothetical protein